MLEGAKQVTEQQLANKRSMSFIMLIRIPLEIHKNSISHPAQITSEVNNAGIFSVNVLGNFQIETVVLGSSRIE